MNNATATFPASIAVQRYGDFSFLQIFLHFFEELQPDNVKPTVINSFPTRFPIHPSWAS